jgi:hypothetical protein
LHDRSHIRSRMRMWADTPQLSRLLWLAKRPSRGTSTL